MAKDDKWTTVETTFKITYSKKQYKKAKKFVKDMKKHRNRVYWVGKEDKTDDELILSHIAHKILSGFYNSYEGWYGSEVILGMNNKRVEQGEEQ
jgi:hypothetical protein